MTEVIVGRNKRKLWRPIVAVVTILILAAGAGVGVRWLQTKDDTKTASGAPKGSGFSKNIDDVQSLRAKGDTAGADARINQALADPNISEKERYNLYVQQGNGLADSQNYDGAIASYTKAEAISVTFEITSLLGDTYNAAGNKEKAIEYYKKAIPLVPASPIQDDEKASLEQAIAALESQP